jgi:hypothetical protein
MARELWRRALLDCDERAWQVVYGNHQRQVHFWVNAQLRFSVDATTRQTLVDDAFLKMAGTFTRHPEKFADYPNLVALLGLLRCCAQRVGQTYDVNEIYTIQKRVKTRLQRSDAFRHDLQDMIGESRDRLGLYTNP